MAENDWKEGTTVKEADFGIHSQEEDQEEETQPNDTGKECACCGKIATLFEMWCDNCYDWYKKYRFGGKIGLAAAIEIRKNVLRVWAITDFTKMSSKEAALARAQISLELVKKYCRKNKIKLDEDDRKKKLLATRSILIQRILKSPTKGTPPPAPKKIRIGSPPTIKIKKVPERTEETEKKEPCKYCCKEPVYKHEMCANCHQGYFNWYQRNVPDILFEKACKLRENIYAWLRALRLPTSYTTKAYKRMRDIMIANYLNRGETNMEPEDMKEMWQQEEEFKPDLWKWPEQTPQGIPIPANESEPMDKTETDTTTEPQAPAKKTPTEDEIEIETETPETAEPEPTNDPDEIKTPELNNEPEDEAEEENEDEDDEETDNEEIDFDEEETGFTIEDETTPDEKKPEKPAEITVLTKPEEPCYTEELSKCPKCSTVLEGGVCNACQNIGKKRPGGADPTRKKGERKMANKEEARLNNFKFSVRNKVGKKEVKDLTEAQWKKLLKMKDEYIAKRRKESGQSDIVLGREFNEKELLNAIKAVKDGSDNKGEAPPKPPEDTAKKDEKEVGSETVVEELGFDKKIALAGELNSKYEEVKTLTEQIAELETKKTALEVSKEEKERRIKYILEVLSDNASAKTPETPGT